MSISECLAAAARARAADRGSAKRKHSAPNVHLQRVVQVGGLEPPTSGSTDQRSNQLSYTCKDSPALRLERPETRCRALIWQVANSRAAEGRLRMQKARAFARAHATQH